jgi:hypothetical protein
MDIITDPGISRKARDQFLSLWNDHVRFTEWK